MATGYGEADAGPVGLRYGSWPPEASASTSPPSAGVLGPCGPTSAAGGGSFDCRSGTGGVAQKPLCDRRPCPRPLGLARPVQAQWVPWRPGAPLFSLRRVAELGAGDVARGGARAARVTAEPDTGGRGGGGVATRSGLEWGRRGGPAWLVTVSAQSSRSSGAGAGQEPGAVTPMLRGRDRSLRQNGLGARAFSQARREPVIAARSRGEASGRARARTAACVEWRPWGHSGSFPAARARLS